MVSSFKIKKRKISGSYIHCRFLQSQFSERKILMAEIRNLQNEFPIRVLKTYRDFYAFSEYSFTFALTTLHSIVVVLGDSQARELVFQIQNKDKKCLLTKYDFFCSSDNRQDCYWDCFKNLRNASSHMLQNYEPRSNENGKFSKIQYTTHAMNSTQKEIKGRELRDFLFNLLELLTDKPNTKKLNKQDSRSYWKAFKRLLFK